MGFLAQGPISGPLCNLWVVVVVVALVGWSAVMWIAERVGKRDRPESSLNLKDAVIIGLVQCVALIPGVSRSGATISAGLLRDLDRVAATRLAFFLAIPALVAGGAYDARATPRHPDDVDLGQCRLILSRANSMLARAIIRMILLAVSAYARSMTR